MGLKNIIVKQAQKTGDKIAKLSALSPQQVEKISNLRNDYFKLLQLENPNDPANVSYTKGLLAAGSVEIFDAYLPQISELYIPVDKDAEFESEFNADYNIRYLNITKWVSDKDENSLEKLINVYEVLSDEDCNIALVFHRTQMDTAVYLAVSNNKNADNNVEANSYINRLSGAVKGNFPGAEWSSHEGKLPFLNNDYDYSVASASNVPGEKSEKFISQTIEKLLDGIVPESYKQEYTLILLATPIRDVEQKKTRLAELYSGLAPYAQWQTNFTYTEANSESSGAQFGVNVGASAGIQNGINQAQTLSNGTTDSQTSGQTDSTGQTVSDSSGTSETDSTSHGTNQSTTNTTSQSSSEARGTSSSHSDTSGSSDTLGGNVSAGVSTNGGVGLGGLLNFGGGGFGSIGVGYNHGWNRGITDTVSSSLTNTATSGTSESVLNGMSEQVSHALARTASHSVANATTRALSSTIGKAITNTVANTVGAFKSTNLGVNFGANFARSSNVTATVGKNEGITQNFMNYNIKHALELLEEQMKRYEQSSALGMWDFAAYVLSEDTDIANNVAHSYIALTQGEMSYMSKAAINVWRGDMGEKSGAAREICGYLRELRHPVFCLDPLKIAQDFDLNVYPTTVTATTSLSSKELAYSLNFPKQSVAGLPVLECAKFGRNIVKYDGTNYSKALMMGNIFHMNRPEKNTVELDINSLASHTFITGSTGAGKSNTVYKILGEAMKHGVNFLVVEPAKGEYKNIFGNMENVSVYGTNANITPLLKIDPFSFPREIHVLEHLDRLVEIFNVCWPMYAAMPAVLKNAIEKSYEDCGWDLITSVNEFGENLYPKFADVARNVKQIIDSSEYDTENKGAYKGSLLTRLNSLTNGINGLIFDEDEIGSEMLFDRNVIVDLSRVGSTETKSLIMGMLVLKLQEHRMTSGDMNVDLKHLTVLEEAHNLLKRTSTEQSTEGANLLGKSVEMISNAIAEMRTYGEGFIIADQAPGILDMAAIRNTNTKIIMRLPDQSDRELVGKSANLNDDQIAELAKLPCGVAAIYQNEWVQPVLCKIDKFDKTREGYRYEQPLHDPTGDLADKRVKIAELILNKTALDRETILRDIAPELDDLKINGGVRAMIYRLLLNPFEEDILLMKIAPIMNELFPEAQEAVKRAHIPNGDPREMTLAAFSALSEVTDYNMQNTIAQAIIKYYLCSDLGNVAEFNAWINREVVKK